MARYVIFPGTAGSYADTPDVNLLDADTAHLQQSVGQWESRSGAGIPELSTDVTPAFGSFVGKINITAVNGGVQAIELPLAGGSETTFSVDMAASATGNDIRLQVLTYDGPGGALLDNVTKDFVGITLSLERVFSTFVVDPAAVVATIRMVATGASTYPFDFYWDAFCIRTGSDATFVPSLRIVGTLFEAFNSTPDDPPIAFAADGTPLTVGVSWAGNLYTYSRHDGADASAPIVAIFDAEDIGL